MDYVCIHFQFGQVETIVAALIDEYPYYLRHHRKRLTFACCFIMFLFGLPLVSQVRNFHSYLPILCR